MPKPAHKLVYPAVVSFGMALAMSGFMSFAMTLVHADGGSFGDALRAWPAAWGHAFPLAWPMAFILVLALLPRLLRLAAWIDDRAHKV